MIVWTAHCIRFGYADVVYALLSLITWHWLFTNDLSWHISLYYVVMGHGKWGLCKMSHGWHQKSSTESQNSSWFLTNSSPVPTGSSQASVPAGGWKPHSCTFFGHPQWFVIYAYSDNNHMLFASNLFLSLIAFS